MKYETVGIICAMEKEAEAIRSAMKSPSRETVGRLQFDVGEIGGHRVVLAVCGIGKVFAATCTQTMILRFQPDCIVNSGVAGSLSEDLNILDLVVASDLVQHDMDTSPLGDPVGLISGLDRVELPADPSLSETILQKAREMGFPAVSGRIASGDQFIASSEQKERIRKLFSPLACEMEGAAVAQVAFAGGVPFQVIRAISDSYLGENAMDYAEFSSLAARRSADLIISLLS